MCGLTSIRRVNAIPLTVFHDVPVAVLGASCALDWWCITFSATLSIIRSSPQSPVRLRRCGLRGLRRSPHIFRGVHPAKLREAAFKLAHAHLADALVGGAEVTRPLQVGYGLLVASIGGLHQVLHPVLLLRQKRPHRVVGVHRNLRVPLVNGVFLAQQVVALFVEHVDALVAQGVFAQGFVELKAVTLQLLPRCRKALSNAVVAFRLCLLHHVFRGELVPCLGKLFLAGEALSGDEVVVVVAHEVILRNGLNDVTLAVLQHGLDLAGGECARQLVVFILRSEGVHGEKLGELRVDFDAILTDSTARKHRLPHLHDLFVGLRSDGVIAASLRVGLGNGELASVRIVPGDAHLVGEKVRRRDDAVCGKLSVAFGVGVHRLAQRSRHHFVRLLPDARGVLKRLDAPFLRCEELTASLGECGKIVGVLRLELVHELRVFLHLAIQPRRSLI